MRFGNWPPLARRLQADQWVYTAFQELSCVEYVEYSAGSADRGFAHAAVANAAIHVQPGHYLTTVRSLARRQHVPTPEPASGSNGPTRQLPASGATDIGATDIGATDIGTTDIGAIKRLGRK